MSTRLSRYASGVIEAAWLAAVILVPVFFNVYSSRIFEPDKIALLRSLGLVILAAWLVKIVEERGLHWVALHPPDGHRTIGVFLRIPLVAPVLALAVVYCLATIFSVTPSVSFWGSYQRLQGTYTTLTYLVIFAALAVNLRRREKVERLVTTIILASLPVGLYGILQRYRLDPVPWGGDVVSRIAANLGNSIFVGAYLIMVFPLTLGRIILSFREILSEETHLIMNMLRATLYIFIACIQVIAVYLSGSRGPALGLGAGIFFTILMLTLFWKKRWMTFAWVGLALTGMIFILAFNIPGSPLARLRLSPAIGRFGQLLDPESNTALVRKYIWKGVVNLVSLHDPLQYPDGSSDRFNFLRPLLGYGPESMYVAYNPFYVPDLAHVEKRNASPDRSHNETWDALVITGVLGLTVYLAVFTAAFYYGLAWLGLIPDRKRRVLFFSLYGFGGLLGAVGLTLLAGREYAGVGLPFGMVIGIILYLVLAVTLTSYEPPRSAGEYLRAVTLVVLLAAILGHFIEINFGISIAVTRTYFWVYLALLLLVGYVLPLYGTYSLVENQPGDPLPTSDRITPPAPSRKKRKDVRSNRRKENGSSGAMPAWLREGWAAAFPVALILGSLGYGYIANIPDVTTSGGLLWGSLTRLRDPAQGHSTALIVMLLLVWVLCTLLAASESPTASTRPGFWRTFLAALGLSGLVTLVFWSAHAGALAGLARSVASTQAEVIEQVARYEGLLLRYYVYVLLVLLTAPLGLVADWSASRGASLAGWLVGAGSLIVALGFAAYSNLRIIQSDIAFKLAEPFAREGTWPVAIDIYNRANDLAPSEDYYYLFLGRAYLEYARSLEDGEQREQVLGTAQRDLIAAQQLNPLNTDHTANLARLNSLWASFSSNETSRAMHAERSNDYFGRALTLSPNSARLWDEWGALALNLLDQPLEALNRFETAREIDPQYDWTYALLGDYAAHQATRAANPADQKTWLAQAADSYQQALKLLPSSDRINRVQYALALANTYRTLGQTGQAISVYQEVMHSVDPDDLWHLAETLAGLYREQGDPENARISLKRAIDLAPADQVERLKTQLDQLTSQP